MQIDERPYKNYKSDEWKTLINSIGSQGTEFENKFLFLSFTQLIRAIVKSNAADLHVAKRMSWEIKMPRDWFRQWKIISLNISQMFHKSIT